MTDQQLCDHFVEIIETDIAKVKERLIELSLNEETHLDCTALFMEYNDILSDNSEQEILCINSETGEVNTYFIEPNDDDDWAPRITLCWDTWVL